MAHDRTANQNTAETALEYANRIRSGFEKKAAHNKSESLWCFKIVIGGTALTTVLLGITDQFWVGRALPATLSAAATVATAWLHRRRPQELWALYRGSQREIEDEVTRYSFKLDEYADADRDKQLASRVADIALNAHRAWTVLVPVPDETRESK